MNEAVRPGPKLAETVIDPTVRLRESRIGKCCEILDQSAVEYSELGDFSRPRLHGR